MSRLDGLRMAGDAVLREAQRVGDDEAAVIGFVHRSLAAQGFTDEIAARQATYVQEHLRAFWSSLQWARCGFPQIVVGDKLSAELMATKIPPELVPELSMPWDTWVIRVPPRLLFMRDCQVGKWDGDLPLDGYDSEDRYVSEIWVFESFEAGRRVARHDGRYDKVQPRTIYCCMNDSTFAGAQLYVGSWSTLGEELELSDAPGSEQALQLAARYVLGAVAMLNNSGITRATSGTRGISRKRGLPKAWTFTLTKPVSVDCRDWVRRATSAKTAKERRLPSVQVLVRGHWKNQPCGPGRSERRFIHVAPYWRGPDDAPIAVRSHVLVGGNSNQVKEEVA